MSETARVCRSSDGSLCPVLSRVIKILLRIDFDVVAGRVGVRELFAGLDHVLEKLDQVGLLHRAAVAENAVLEFFLAAKVMLAEALRASRGEFRDAREFAVRLGIGNFAI